VTLALLGSYMRGPDRAARIWGAVSLGVAVLMAIGIVSLTRN
jgi:hypothetical protein